MARRAGQAIRFGMVRVSDKATWGKNAKTTSWSIPSWQYLLQNWRADVARATDSSGNITDRVRDAAYGEPQRFGLSDLGTVGGNIPACIFPPSDKGLRSTNA
jgi:hypothetical protein